MNVVKMFYNISKLMTILLLRSTYQHGKISLTQREMDSTTYAASLYKFLACALVALLWLLFSTSLGDVVGK